MIDATLIAWMCFLVACISAIGNDSIQTLGTFLTSNHKSPWWKLWIFIGGIYVATIFYGFYIEEDLAFGRLDRIPEVESLNIWQILAPFVLVLLTVCKVPVSTTFLLLSLFATGKTIEKMILKSFLGYGLAFGVGLIIFAVVFYIPYFKKDLSEKEFKTWRVFQWITTAFLWCNWLMQDTANIVVFLPRDLSLGSVFVIALIGFLVIGFVLYRRGGRIQSLVTEKKDVTDVRAATVIDFSLAFILLYFKTVNNIPMSTTWVFLGLLAGRESILTVLATLKHTDKQSQYLKTLKLVLKDIALATLGIVVSIMLVIAASL